MQRVRFAILITLALAFVAGAGGAHSPGAGADGPPPPPAEFQSQFNELTQKLTTFEATLDSQWDGSVVPSKFAGALASANGNKTVGLLQPATWTSSMQLLDAYQAMGVSLIKLDIQYPLLTPAFHTYLAAHPPPSVPGYNFSVANFIGTPNSFYNKLVADIRSRGMGVWVEHGTLFADYSPTPATGYFAGMRTAGLAVTQSRYTQERAAESALIVTQLRPDYYAVLEEPNTQAMNFGYFPGNVPIFDVSGWTTFVHAMTSAIASAAPGSTTLIGAGIGTWDTADYLTSFAPLADLDFFDMHTYPLQSLTADYLQRMLDWADYVRSVSPGKLITVGEAWAWKTTAAEVSAGVNYEDIYGRDVYSFWQPVDEQFLDVLFKMMQVKHFTAVMPFWAQYYFAYLTYGDPGVVGLNGVQLVGAAGAAAAQNWATVTLTDTGRHFQQLAQTPLDADGDTIPDANDNCPAWANLTQALPNWAVPAGDSDCDGFPDSVKVGTHAGEAFIGTDSTRQCAATRTRNDEPAPDAWPMDYDDNQLVNLQDIGLLSPHEGTRPGDLNYAVRFDLNGDSLINLQDIGQFNPFFGKFCAP